MAPSRAERRTRNRRSCSLYLQLVNIRTGEPMGSLTDISLDGFRLESTRPIPLQVEFIFRLDVPHEICDRPCIKLMARSRWCKPDPIDSRLFDVGFEITGLDAGDVHILRQVIERYGSSMISGNSDMGYLWGK
jgi:PilZ domain-containing protein